MNKYLPEKEELIPITDKSMTFYDCGFNKDFELLDFKKKLEIVNNLVRQSIIPTNRASFDDEDTLIGNCLTACKVSMKYLKELNLSDEIECVFARKRKFDPEDKPTVHSILLIKHDGITYQYDATPFVGYKFGCVENINLDRWYEEYIPIDEEMLHYIEIMKEIVYNDYHNLYDEDKTNYYLSKLEEAEKIEILHGYITHTYEIILKHIKNSDKIVDKITSLDPYNIRNESNVKHRNSLIIKQAKDWLEELSYLDNSNLKLKLELTQNILQELKFVYPELEKWIEINGKKYRLSFITPRVLMENGLNVVIIKPSAYYLGVQDKIRERLSIEPLLNEYSINLGDNNSSPMLYSHPLGLKCIREYTGRSDVMFTTIEVNKLKEIKKELRNLGNDFYGKEVTWTDGKKILFSPYTTNLVHSTDSYAEACLHYMIGFVEHQSMTRFMYPNLKLEKVKKYE